MKHNGSQLKIEMWLDYEGKVIRSTNNVLVNISVG